MQTHASVYSCISQTRFYEFLFQKYSYKFENLGGKSEGMYKSNLASRQHIPSVVIIPPDHFCRGNVSIKTKKLAISRELLSTNIISNIGRE